MKYLTVNKDLLLTPQSKSANMEVLVLYYIRTKCNKDCASAIGEDKIQKELNLSESTVEGYIKKLKDYTSILTIKTLNPNDSDSRKEIEQVLGKPFEGTKIRKNLYYFKEPTAFYFLYPQFIYRTDLPNEIKGFLIRLACLCVPGTGKIYTPDCRKEKANIASISKDLKTSRTKAKTLLEECERLNLIRHIPRGYIILEDSFRLNYGKTVEDRVYNAIYNYCLNKNVVPPDRYEFYRNGNSTECDGLLMCTPYLFNIWNLYKAQSFRHNKKFIPLEFEDYLKLELLPKRFPTLPEEPHWEYFKKAILNISPKKQQPLEHRYLTL